jgi:hypothetical protein
MKTLASCKPSEFLKQTNLIRKSVEKWLTETDIMNIRKRLPHREAIPIDATSEEREAINARNEKAIKEQMSQNLSAILDAVLEEHADETLEVMALCCFVEPKDVDSHTMAEYLSAINELINDESVMSFFTSLVRMGQISTQSASRL